MSHIIRFCSGDDGGITTAVCGEKLGTTDTVVPITKRTQGVSRAECLDDSGDDENWEICSDCPNFRVTRKLLLKK